MTDQQDKQQIIIDGLITILGYREQKNQRTGTRKHCLENKSGNRRKKERISFEET